MIVVVLRIMVVFIMGRVQVLVGRVALIFSFVVTIMLNTWKTCQWESLFRPN